MDDFYKRAFYFYEHTGCRAIEPFIGELIGDWLIVDVEQSKSKFVRQIQLNNRLKEILLEMQDFRDAYAKNGSTKPIEAAYHRIAKMMRKVVKSLNLSNCNKISLKSFRHTFGIKQVTLTGNIYQVSRDMGHSHVTTTQIYLQYPEQRRLYDFPSLKHLIIDTENIRLNAIRDTHFRDTDNRSFLNAPQQIDN